MNESDSGQDSDVDFLLSQRNRTAAAAHLRESTLTRTLGVIRFRRRAKRAGIVTGFAGCYLAGVLTMSVWRPDPGDRAAVQPAKVSPATEKHGAKTRIAAAPLSPYDRLRRTGDRQLGVDGDIAAAARTYRQALAVASAGERELVPDKDNWLLLAIKTDQPQEKLP